MAQLVLRNILAGSGNVLAGGDNSGNVNKITIGSGLTLTSGVLSSSGGGSSLILTTIGTSGAATYSSITGILNIPIYSAATGSVSSVFGRTGTVIAASGDYNTDLVTEGSTNLYYSNDRARSAFSATTPLSYNSTTGIFTISQASTSTNGYLSSTNWNTFNNKQAALNGTGFVKISGTTISYDNSTYLTTSSAASTYLPLSGGTLTGALGGTSATFSNSVTANTYLNSINQVIANNTITSPTNDNTLTNGTVYSLNGITTVNNYGIGLSSIRNGAYDIWFQTGSNNGGGYRWYIGTTEKMTMSNIGNVGINTTSPTYTLDVTGTGRFSSSVTASSLIKSGGTSSQFLKADGSTDSSAYITLTSLSAVNPLFYNTTFGTFSINQANTSTSGYVSSADWNTFNNKQPAGAYLTANQNINFQTYLGDVSGSSLGNTNLNPTLVLNTITQSTGSSFVKITLDTKGRVIGNTSVSSSDITSTLGYTPYNATNPNGYIALTSLSAVNPLFYNTTYGTFTINVANTSQSGYLTSSDWNTFNNKQPAGSYLTGNQSIFFNPSGDVTGTSNGATTLNPVLTLATITQGSGSDFVKINIDTKGRVIGNTSVSSSDITSVLGYTPYNSTNPSGYITSAGSSAYATSAGSISGFNNPTTAGTANTIAYRDSFGYLYAIAFYEYSDIRFKNVLETNPIIEVKGIDVIKFNRKDNTSIRYGYSAQQVKEFVPEAVSGDSELVVNYSDIHTLKIAALERRILELENKLK